MKTAITLTVAILANAVGNLFLGEGMRNFHPAGVSSASWLVLATVRLVTNPWLIGGILLLILFLAAYLAALSWADLSFVLPATAPSYVLTASLAAIFLHEVISPARWAGTILIMAGTGLVAGSYAPSRAKASRAFWRRRSADLSAGADPPPAEGGAA